MDFYQIKVKETKGVPELYPDFTVGRSKDLMVRGRSFYAIWDDAAGLWSTDEYDVQRLVDESLDRWAEESGGKYNIKYLKSFSTNVWAQFKKFMMNVSDNSHQLDCSLTFANTVVKKSDYVSKRLPYALEAGDFSAWDELIGTLYSPDERAKIEWAIGSVISGDSKRIQKFLVLYGPAGSGKSTILNVVQKLFIGYTTSFEAKALGSNNNSFSTEVFKTNPLVAIQHDGDLSRIEDNTKLNSLISHEDMTMNEKYKPSYTARSNALLFMGTNQPVRISDAKSGIIRRLIDVHPSGNRIPINHYNSLMSRIDFELGAIAQHCLEVYLELGKNYYNSYRPLEMMLQTDIFFNFIEAYFDVFKTQDGVTLKQAYEFYKVFCDETGIDKKLPQYKVREELRNYFEDFKDRATVNGTLVRSWYSGFIANKFKSQDKSEKTFSLVMDEKESLLDSELAGLPAQLANSDDLPMLPWANVRTTLSDINTSRVHFVKLPENHIVVDFDIRDDNGGKSLERNLAAASIWPPTYAEISKGGNGVHLHYNYLGDVTKLRNSYSDGIEIKTLLGDASLRRKLTKCNNVSIATLNGGLPLKEKKVLPSNVIKSEKGLRQLIERNLRKEIHPGTKPSIDFIHKILEEAYDSGMQYDVSDLRPRIVAFANNSTNQALRSIKIVQTMKFKSEKSEDLPEEPADDRLVLFDVEVFPNLLVICWKYQGSNNVVRMINPSPTDVEKLFSFKLVGFNVRRYDNHILYARYLGYDNARLYALSQKIISGDKSAMFGEAYNLSYADIYDFSSVKQSLKRFQIDLGIFHLELDLPWDQPVPDDMVGKVVEYCVNDVIAEEAVFESRKADFVARQILSDLSGLSVNSTTQQHTARIIFGSDRRPQEKFVYTDLSKEFPGYSFDRGVSSYREEVTGEGGYVFAQPGMYENVALLDVASMHPTSIEVLNLFGPYTHHFSELKTARLAIKHKDYVLARKLLGGKLKPYLTSEENADALAYALKIVINIVYGLTAARFDNSFRDPRNIDNIVAKRGALFMIDLKHHVQSLGYTVAHIKTDSIKIPNATPEIINEVMLFGEKYGYLFEHEVTYEKLCLVNDAVYIAKKDEHWVAVGAQFQHPYVFKTLFSHEELTFEDFCETRQVTQGAMYLDFDAVQKPMFDYQGRHFVGRTGRFVPVTPESGGGLLLRVKDDKSYAVVGTKGFFWIEASVAKSMGNKVDIDMAYFEALARDAIKSINSFGDWEVFCS